MTGLTLVELLVTLTVLITLMTLAVPSFQAQIAASRVTAATNELTATLARARNEAIRLGSRVTVCRANAALTGCSSTSGEGWERGWLVFVDPTRSTTPAIDSGETVTFKVQPYDGDLLMLGNSDYVSFAPDGRSKQMNGAFLAATIRVCSRSGALENTDRARDLVLSATGRVVVDKPTVASTCPAPSP